MMKEEFSEGAENVSAGIFCDWMDTIFRPTADDLFDRDLIDYLNREYSKGTRVTVISTLVDHSLRILLAESGLHPDIIENPTSKNSLEYAAKTLEVLIDDSPSKNLKSKTYWHPDSPGFRTLLRQDQLGAPPLVPEQP